MLNVSAALLGAYMLEFFDSALPSRIPSGQNSVSDLLPDWMGEQFHGFLLGLSHYDGLNLQAKNPMWS